MRIKLCGMRREEDIETVNCLKPDYIGYVFAKKSPRFVRPFAAARLSAKLDPGIIPVGVFVNEDPDAVLQLIQNKTIRAVQLHGTEDEMYLRVLRCRMEKAMPGQNVPLIKAFGIREAKDIQAANCSSADYVLLDGVQGGSGRQFDHSLLSGIRRPYFLAGGLDPDNAAGILEDLIGRSSGALGRAGIDFLHAVDVSSGIEADGMKGIKDAKKMRRFMEAVKSIQIKGVQE